MLINDTHKNKINNSDNLNFIELVQLWKNFACHYRKTRKQLPRRNCAISETTINGFKYQDEVPQFLLSEEIEDYVWAFERLTHKCYINEEINNKIKNYEKITIKEVCLGTGINCKEGVHEECEMICCDDFLYGGCSCPSYQDLQNQTNELENEKKEHVKELSNLSSFKGVNHGYRNKLHRDIKKIEKSIQKILNSRKIHYTELGMIPYTTQYTDYLENSEKVEMKKNDWDHDLVGETVKKQVVKVNKLGKKK
jgi:hypothetical protein